MHERRVQLRYDQREGVIEGPVFTYGDVGVALDANTGQMVRERVNAARVDRNTALNIQHTQEHAVARIGDGLDLDDDGAALRLRAKLSGPSAELAYKLLERGALTGLSAEYIDLARVTDPRGVDDVEALVVGVGLVDRPAFPRARVQLRVGEQIEALIPTGVDLSCKCQGPKCDTVRFEPGAFDSLMRGEQGDTLVIRDQYASALASQRRGSLLFETTEAGLVARFALPDTDDAREIIGQSAAVDLIARPFIDVERSTYREEGRLRIFDNVWVRAISLLATDADGGWPVLGVGIAAALQRRERMLWLSL